MALLLAPSRIRRRRSTLPLRPSHRVEGPPSVVFTRMSEARDRWCLDCARPTVVEVEDYAACSGWRRREPVAYLQCTSCGSRDQHESPTAAA